MILDDAQFSPADYDFSEILTSGDQVEQEACVYYEYARESNAVIAMVKNLRKQTRARKGSAGEVDFGRLAPDHAQSALLVYLSSFAGFPLTPWSNLPEAQRQFFRKLVHAIPEMNFIGSTSRNPPLLFDLTEPGKITLAEWRQKVADRRRAALDDPTIKLGFFAVNLDYPDEILLKGFQQYIRNFRGKPMIEIPVRTKKKCKPPGRKNSTLDFLNALAAMRLRYRYRKFSDAHPHAKGQAGKFLPEQRRSFNRTADHALKYFHELFGWIDTSMPIHYKKNFERAGTQ